MDISYQSALPEVFRPIVVIGAGGIVRDAHLPAYEKVGFNVHGITNRTRSKAEELAARFGIPKVYDTIADAVAGAPEDAVYDLTLMPSQFLRALEQLPDGATVLIQKPMGDSFAQANEVLEVCRRKGLKASVNCQLRFAPFVMAARDLVERGLIGELYDLEVRVTVDTPWERFPNVMRHERLEIQQHSIHYVDLVRSFLGDPQGIWAKTCGNPHTRFSSTRTSIIFEYGEKLRASISTNHDHRFGGKHKESFIKWEGTKGAIKAQFGLLKDYPKGEADSFEYCLLEEDAAPVWKTVELAGSWFPEAFAGSMASAMRFAEGGDAAVAADVEDVAKTMACVEAAYESSARGATEIPAVAKD